MIQFTGKPLPLGTVLKLEIAGEREKHMTLPKPTPQMSDDFVRIEVRVAIIKRENKSYIQEANPLIHFDMHHMFQAVKTFNNHIQLTTPKSATARRNEASTSALLYELLVDLMRKGVYYSDT